MELIDLDGIKAISSPYIKKQSVYFLFKAGAIVYVGCSVHPFQRISTHATGKWAKDFDSFSVVPVPEGMDMEDLERMYIAKFKPSINRVSLLPKTFDPTGGEGTPLERVMRRIAAGQSVYSAAKAEKINPSKIYGSKAYRAWKDEADQLLLQPGHVRPSKEGFRHNWNVGVRVHQALNRGSIKKFKAVKGEPNFRTAARLAREVRQQEKQLGFDF
ncbi:GIY-YIG nuclease family protein [Paraburkholderia fungorum]|uniref:GIY-YIG nuclease family protein n=1 Tax=Paraburkholderia fungorum TaxID=134537 RepID=UPI003877EF31